jgi:hypothetical protein
MLFLRVRFAAFGLVRQLCRSLLQDEEPTWKIDCDTSDRPVLTSGSFRILIVPRAVRLFDAVHLYCDDVETWLPILARLRLRNAVRHYLLRTALEQLDDGEQSATKPTRTRRKQPATSS